VSDTIDHGPAPRPAWRTEDGDLVHAADLRSDDVEIDLTGDRAVERRAQYPKIDHPWAANWPTWPYLSVARD
jgi:hypothetical protein